MYAAIVHAFDAPPRYATFAEPVAAEGEKLVTVSAAGLHPIVKALAKNLIYQYSLQLDTMVYMKLCPRALSHYPSQNSKAWLKLL